MTDTNDTNDTNDDATRDAPKADDDGRYPAEIVQKLRDENAQRRTRAREAEEQLSGANDQIEALTTRLVAASVAEHASGLADPADLLTYIEAADVIGDDGLPSPDKITAAAADLVKQKPHLATRTPTGDADQGARDDQPEPFDFAARLRAAAG